MLLLLLSLSLVNCGGRALLRTYTEFRHFNVECIRAKVVIKGDPIFRLVVSQINYLLLVGRLPVTE